MALLVCFLWYPTPVLLPGKSHGRRSLVGCSPWGREESDTTERLHFHFPLSCIGEGNGNPLQCSCLDNPRDGGAWWAAVYGIAQSQTRLKWLSSLLPVEKRFSVLEIQHPRDSAWEYEKLNEGLYTKSSVNHLRNNHADNLFIDVNKVI